MQRTIERGGRHLITRSSPGTNPTAIWGKARAYASNMPGEFDALSVVEIIRPIESGATTPYQCRLEDDHLYAVKGKAALARGLMGEMYAGSLGRRLGLPIPSFSLAFVSKPLLESYSDMEVRRALGTGPLFASLWQEPVEGLKTPDLTSFSQRDLAALYVFDHWIENGDRTLSEHGGNANLLVSLTHKNLIVIDHNLAFMPSYKAEELRLHACRGAWLEARRDLVFRGELERRMRYAMTMVANLEAELPEEWIDDEPDFMAYARTALDRMNQPDFWAELG